MLKWIMEVLLQLVKAIGASADVHDDTAARVRGFVAYCALRSKGNIQFLLQWSVRIGPELDMCGRLLNMT